MSGIGMSSAGMSSAGDLVSVVICTDGRAAALRDTLTALAYLDGPDFEVCVVAGPTPDGTDDVLAGWAGRIKIARNPMRNLSASRNLGIGLAAGRFVAFIDDDGVPEAEWLTQILTAFGDPAVAAAGGMVMDHTGLRPQYRYASADRLGNADLGRTTPAHEFNFPLSFNFPYVQGTNSVFRRDALLGIGGFDEEYEFYLDETDLCCRLVDAGYAIRQLPDAVVHHKYLPSAIRTPERVTRALFAVLKNKLYFSLINNKGHYPVRTAIEDMAAFVRTREADLRAHLDARRVTVHDMDEFYRDVDRAWETGLARGLSGERRLREAGPSEPPAFLRLPRPIPAGAKGNFVFVSQEFPPDRAGGIGRHVYELSRAVAAMGHQVHVVTATAGHDRLDFEDGVWVHRAATRFDDAPIPADVPPYVWCRARTVLETVQRIAAARPVTAVHAPVWDCEGIAVLRDGGFALATGLHTPLKLWMDSNPAAAARPGFARDFAALMVRLEQAVMLDCDAIHANSHAIVAAIEDRYGIALPADRVAVIHHGVADWAALPARAPAALPAGAIRLLFVGRLEPRKGIDVLLDILPDLLARHASVHVDIVGDDTIANEDGVPFRAAFETKAAPAMLRRVRFHGPADDARLRGFYRACDVFVAPSRFESFGLILIEAMIFARPVAASDAGGMTEVAGDPPAALLSPPGDAAALLRNLETLIGDAALRRRLGEAGRARYEVAFTAETMARRAVALLWRAHDRHGRRAMAAAP
jgi:glycosyltransferase involved in cell wall biosynthesis/GT2 family glycosyltransferase